MQEILPYKLFWVTAGLIGPFIFIWIAESLPMAIVVYAVLGGMLLASKIQMGQRRSRQDGGNFHVYLDIRAEGRGKAKNSPTRSLDVFCRNAHPLPVTAPGRVDPPMKR